MYVGTVSLCFYESVLLKVFNTMENMPIICNKALHITPQ